LQRPLDSKSQVRIILEAEAVLGILAFCETGEIDLVSSDAIRYEIEGCPNITRREYTFEVLSIAKVDVRLNESVEKRARKFSLVNIRPLDALHLAMAEHAQVDYFCTCDDDFLKKAKALKNLKVKAVSPIELVGEIESWTQ